MKDIEIPPELAWLNPKSWPHQSSETGMRQIADHCYSQAQAMADLNSDLQQTRQRVQQALTGATAETADQQLLKGADRVDTLVGDLRAHGKSAEVSATHIEDAKRKSVTTLAIAANSIIAAVSDWQRTGNPSPLMQIPIVKELAEYSIGKAVSDAGGRIGDTLTGKLASTMMAGLPDAGAAAAAITGGQFAVGHRIDIGDVLHSALSMGVAGPGTLVGSGVGGHVGPLLGQDGSTTALAALQTALHHAPANVQPTGIQLATQHSTGAGAPVYGRVPIHEEHTGSITREVVDASVNGGPKVPMVLDTGSNGAVIPITDIGLQHLGLPTGFHQTSYGSSLGGQTEGVLTFNAPIDLGNGVVTAPTQVNVPLYSYIHLGQGPFSPGLPVPFVPPFTNFLLGGVGGPDIHGIMGIGPSATGPSPQPFLSALPAPLNQGVLINAPAGYLQFGSPPPDGDAVYGSPITTLGVSINHGPLVPLTTAIDSGGVTGNLPASVLGHNTVPILNIPHVGSFGENVALGTDIQWYDPRSHTLLAQTTTTDSDAPAVTPDGEVANTGVDLFHQEPVYIGIGPNPGSPGPPPFLPNRGTTIIYPGRR